MRAAIVCVLLLLPACGGDGVGGDAVAVAATAIAVAAPGATGVQYAPPPPGRIGPSKGRSGGLPIPDEDDAEPLPLPVDPFAPAPGGLDGGLAVPKPPAVPLAPLPPTPPSKKGTQL